MFALDSTPLSPDGPTARRWLSKELSNPEYAQHKSLRERIIDWLEGHIPDASIGGLTIPWYVLALIVVLGLVAVAVYSSRRFARTQASHRHEPTGAAPVFGSASPHEAQTYREEAERLQQTDPSAAALAAYRAVVSRAGALGLLELTAATTVGDVDAALLPALPERRDAVLAASSTFAAVRYGRLSATPEQVRQVLILDDALTPARTGDST